MRRLPCSWSGPPARYSGCPRVRSIAIRRLPVEIYNYAKEPDTRFQTVAAGGILILVVLLLMMNSTAILIRNRYRRYH